jgi:excisionase family DNA binding protein
MTPRLLTISDAARMLTVSPWTIRAWLRAKPPKLQFVRLGRRLAIEIAAIERLIEQGRVEAQDGER